MSDTRTVEVVVRLRVEVEAPSDEQAFMGVMECFDVRRPSDPLYGVLFPPESTHCGDMAEIKTCEAMGLEFQNYDPSWELWDDRSWKLWGGEYTDHKNHQKG